MLKNPRAICFVSHSSGKYGAEKALLELIVGLKQSGVACHVILPKNGPLAEELTGLGVPFRTFPYKRWTGKEGRNSSRGWARARRMLLNLLSPVALAFMIRRWRCDVVYTNTSTICVGALAARLLGVPHVWHVHEIGYEHNRLLFDLGERRAMAWMDRLSALCVTNSAVVARKYERWIRADKVKIVYQSVTVPEFRSVSAPEKRNAAPFTCVIVGSLTEDKGQELALRAVAGLRDQGLEIELLVLGDAKKTDYRNRLLRLGEELGISRQVRFMGYVADPFPIMRQVDAVLVCSRFEAFGRVAVESMLLGKPVIGADSGGTAELIQDGFNGLLFVPGDAADLAVKIRHLQAHPEEARSMGAAGRAWAEERFTRERYAGEILALLNQYCGCEK